jgi:hypothetical protein
MTSITASSSESRLGSGFVRWVWILAVTFIYLFSFQTCYPIVNPGVQKDMGLSDSPLADIGLGPNRCGLVLCPCPKPIGVLAAVLFLTMDDKMTPIADRDFEDCVEGFAGRSGDQV